MLVFFNNNICTFSYDLAYAYQISSKRVHSRQSYDVVSIFKMVAIELEI